MAKYSQQVKFYEDFKGILTQINDSKQIIGDPEEDAELKAVAEEELEETLEELDDFLEDIIDTLIPSSEADARNCSLEVMQAAGGSESSLFAGEIFDMYKAYCRLMGFRVQQTEFMKDMQIDKGCKKGVLSIKGTDVFKYLKHESGVHKVQRVPETEKQGRLHSSTCIVLVVPEVPSEFVMDMKEVRLDFMRAQGAGGQHVNKTDSACRATHIPTGISAVS